MNEQETKAMNDARRILNGVRSGDDGSWKFIDNVIANIDEALAATAPEKVDQSGLSRERALAMVATGKPVMDLLREAFELGGAKVDVSNARILDILASHEIGWADEDGITPFNGDVGDTYITAIRKILAECIAQPTIQQSLQVADGWVSVKDRLPQPCLSVLIAMPSGLIDKTCWYAGEFLRPSKEQPTHWQPLPAPPAQQEGA